MLMQFIFELLLLVQKKPYIHLTNDIYNVNDIVDSVKVYTKYKYICLNNKGRVKVICLRT